MELLRDVFPYLVDILQNLRVVGKIVAEVVNQGTDREEDNNHIELPQALHRLFLQDPDLPQRRRNPLLYFLASAGESLAYLLR